MVTMTEPDVPSTDLNLYDPALRADPFPAYARLREAGPLLRRHPSIYLVARHAESAAVLLDPAFGHGYSAGINPFRPGVDPATLPGSFLLMDPPDHTRLRRLVSKAFTARAIGALRASVTALVDELLDEAIGAGEVDLVARLTVPVPLTTICRLLAIPQADRAEFQRWAADISRGLDPDGTLTATEIAARNEAVTWFNDYFTALVTDRRRLFDERGEEPEDLVGQLAAVAGDDGPLTVAELTQICLLLLVGGFDTINSMLSSGILALSRHPDQWELLRRAPHLAGKAVEEFLRYDSPVPFPVRVALTDTEIAGWQLPRGTGVIVVVGAANRDPRAYAEPDRLDLARFVGDQSVPPHLGFSHGPHFCLGAPLARLEGEIVFARLAGRVADIAVPDGPPDYKGGGSIRSMTRLPTRLSPPAAPRTAPAAAVHGGGR
jgi:cytochrome P450